MLEQSSLELAATSYLAGFTIGLGIVAPELVESAVQPDSESFAHVVVTSLHFAFGILFGANVGYGTLATSTLVVTTGNVVGGLGLVTLSHVAQVVGEEDGS